MEFNTFVILNMNFIEFWKILRYPAGKMCITLNPFALYPRMCKFANDFQDSQIERMGVSLRVHFVPSPPLTSTRSAEECNSTVYSNASDPPRSTEEIIRKTAKSMHLLRFWVSHASHSTKEIMERIKEIDACTKILGFPRFPKS